MGHNGCGVWDSIKATQPNIEGTLIPKSFEISAKGSKYWVHPNASKHMAELLKSKGVYNSTPKLNDNAQFNLNNQIILTNFHIAIEDATLKGFEYDKIINIGRWELIFSKSRTTDGLDVIKHALFR